MTVGVINIVDHIFSIWPGIDAAILSRMSHQISATGPKASDPGNVHDPEIRPLSKIVGRLEKTPFHRRETAVESLRPSSATFAPSLMPFSIMVDQLFA